MSCSRVPSVLLCVVVLVVGAASVVPAAGLRFIDPPNGYEIGFVNLGPGNSVTTLAVDPAGERHVYAAGMFGGRERIVRINLETSSRTMVFDCPSTVSVAGFAVLTSATIYVSDNYHDHLLVLRDFNPRDGDFNDPGEARDLIAPILTDPTFGWTGSAVQIVRAAPNRLGLSAGTVLFQSEDGGTTLGEVLAVKDPLTSPAYQPAGAAFFTGADYGGGIAIDAFGRLAVASSSYPELGRVWVCEDRSGNGAIEPGEARLLALDGVTSGASGLSTLAVDGVNRAYVTTALPTGGAPLSEIMAFYLPADPGASPRVEVARFGTLDSPYVSSIILTSAKPFWPRARNGATMIIAGYVGFWEPSDRLVTVKPLPSLGVRKWNLYN
jgi:hypothetical protein